MSVATGLAAGREARPDLAQSAVTLAMQQLGVVTANSVLLYLTSEFAREPVPALRAAARAANCTQVIGCTVPGLFTEQDWVLDTPAAAAMVFAGDMALLPATGDSQLMLTLAAPNALQSSWLGTGGQRFGGVSGDAGGQGPFSVWRNGKGVAEGHCEVMVSGAVGAVGAAHGVQALSEPKPVTASQGHNVVFLGGKPALETLQYGCRGLAGEEYLPLHRLMAGIAASAEDARAGHYRLAALIGVNEQDRSVTLARETQPGQYVFWAMRDTGAAQRDLQTTVTQVMEQLAAPPQFGMMFSCLGRGPYFYRGVDLDLDLVRSEVPGIPLIGFYGNGEIAPVPGTNGQLQNELLQYSAVLGLFHGVIGGEA